MSLLEICRYIQESTIGTAIRESTYVFPIVETLHVLGLALSVGVILMVDLRLIGARMRSEPFSEVLQQLEPWSMIGFVTMFLTGAVLFWSEALRCYNSNTFRIKIILLALTGVNALVFHKTVYRNASAWDRDPALLPAGAKIAGWLGLVLWTGVIGYGRWTAYGMK